MRLSRILFSLLLLISVPAFAFQTPDQNKPAKSAKSTKAPKVDPGIKKYGNVTFADPEHHKYPIDNAAHTRAAWSSIHIKSHAAKYKPEELAQIRQRIHDAGVAQGVKFSEDKPKTSKSKAKSPSK